MLARDTITQLLDGAMPDTVDVIGYARGIDPPSSQTVMVRVDRVTPAADVSGAVWKVEASLVLIEPGTTPGASDDALDGLLQDVLYALDTQDVSRHLTWTEAKRATYAPVDTPTNPAYEVAVTAYIQKESTPA